MTTIDRIMLQALFGITIGQLLADITLELIK